MLLQLLFIAETVAKASLVFFISSLVPKIVLDQWFIRVNETLTQQSNETQTGLADCM